MINIQAFYNMVKLGKRSKRSIDPQEECLEGLFESYKELENMKNICPYEQEEDCLRSYPSFSRLLIEFFIEFCIVLGRKLPKLS